jgi:hypothetical protein
MFDILTFSAPLLTVGSIAGLLFPHEPAAVLAMQAIMVAVELLGAAVGTLLASRPE